MLERIIKIAREIVGAIIIAALVFGPFVYYFYFVMQP